MKLRRKKPGRAAAAGEQGVTLVEVLVATLVFSITATALAGTLARAEHARRTSEKWLGASQLAAERLELLRAGDRTADEAPVRGFERTWRSFSEPGVPGVERVEVRVSWQDDGLRSFTLVSLLRASE